MIETSLSKGKGFWRTARDLSGGLSPTIASRELKRDAALHAAAGLCVTLVLAGGTHLWLALPLSGILLAAFVYAAFMGALLLRLRDHLPHTRWGVANRVTLFRAALVATLAATAAYPSVLSSHGWAATGMMALAYALDGVDGWVARQYAITSAFGARLDQELDALYTLVLSLAILRLGNADAWILIAGVWHYVFHGLRALSPAFRRSLPFSQRRRVICALTVLFLIVCASPLFPAPAAASLAAGTVALLSASFLVDIIWLIRLETAARRD